MEIENEVAVSPTPGRAVAALAIRVARGEPIGVDAQVFGDLLRAVDMTSDDFTGKVEELVRLEAGGELDGVLFEAANARLGHETDVARLALGW